MPSTHILRLEFVQLSRRGFPLAEHLVASCSPFVVLPAAALVPVVGADLRVTVVHGDWPAVLSGCDGVVGHDGQALMIEGSSFSRPQQRTAAVLVLVTTVVCHLTGGVMDQPSSQPQQAACATLMAGQ